MTSDVEPTVRPSRGRVRVLQVALSLNPGGTERLILDLVTRLHDQIPMAVCCLDEPGAWASQLEAHKIAVTAIRRKPGFTPSSAAGIARAAREHGATAIHAHHYSPFVYSCLAQLQGRTPVVFTEHGRQSDAGPSPKRRLANRVLRRVPARVFAVSAELADYLAEEGFSRSQIGVIYNGVDPGPRENGEARRSRRAELGARAEDFLVGTIARLDPVKDLGALLQAIALMTPQRSVKLVVVGDGDERGRLEARAKELNVQGHVKFLGKRDDAREWLWACDAYVNSSISEGVSLTILEAMAAGLPVVATRVGGTPEVVSTDTGILVPARDPSAIAGALSPLVQEPALRRALGQAARERLESRFTIDRMVREYADVYGDVTNGGASDRPITAN